MSSDASKVSNKMGGMVAKFNPETKMAIQASATSPALGRRTIIAFALGFAFVSGAAYVTGGDLNRAFARDDAGMHDFLMQNQLKKPFYRAPVFYTPTTRAPTANLPDPAFKANAPSQQWSVRPHRLRGFANLPHNIAPLRQKALNQPQRLAGATDPSIFVDASGLPRRSYCVRLCDGYYFPVAPVSNDGDLNAHESLCAGICPGAPTRLFIMPGGSERIEEATSRDGHKYSALPVAFRHTGTIDNTCTCRPENIAHTKIVSVLKDFTLRQGDMVMGAKGFRVFRGSSHWPYGQSDFMSLAESGINSKNRAALSAIESATRQTGARPLELPAAKLEKSALARAIDAPAVEEVLVQARGKQIRRIGPEVYIGE